MNIFNDAAVNLKDDLSKGKESLLLDLSFVKGVKFPKSIKGTSIKIENVILRGVKIGVSELGVHVIVEDIVVQVYGLASSLVSINISFGLRGFYEFLGDAELTVSSQRMTNFKVLRGGIFSNMSSLVRSDLQIQQDAEKHISLIIPKMISQFVEM